MAMSYDVLIENEEKGFKGVFLGLDDDGERRLRGSGFKASNGLVLVCVISVQGWSLEV